MIITCNVFESLIFGLLQTGHIFVHTGLMQMVLNDDQLAFVLAHEMAHAVLGHGVSHQTLKMILLY